MNERRKSSLLSLLLYLPLCLRPEEDMASKQHSPNHSLPTTWLPGLFSNCPSHPRQAKGLAETCQSHGHCGRREELWVMPHPHGQHLFRSLNQAGRPSLLPSTFSEDQARNSHLSRSGKKVVLNPGFQQEGFEKVQVPGALLQSIQVRILENGMG